jgi:hypothetical protein
VAPFFALIFFQLLFLQIQRFIFFIFLPNLNFFELKLIEFFDFFIACLRFDLMVVGFFLIPILAINFLGIYKKAAIRFYVFISSLIMWASSVFDYLWFEKTGDRLGRDFFSSENIIPDVFRFKYLFVILLLCLASYVFYKVSIIFSDKLSKLTLGWKRFLVFILFTLILARGSLSAHHLDLRHAVLTKNPKINRLIIPSPYALDQALRNRR